MKESILPDSAAPEGGASDSVNKKAVFLGLRVIANVSKETKLLQNLIIIAICMPKVSLLSFSFITTINNNYCVLTRHQLCSIKSE